MMSKQKKLKVGLSNLFSSPPPPQPDAAPPVEATPPPPAPTSAPVAEKTVAPAAPPVEEKQPEPAAVTQPAKKQVNVDDFDGDETQLVVFRLGDEFFGVDISIVESIIKAKKITLVPHAHEFVEGVTNLRGIIVPVIDLRTRFGMPRLAASKETSIIVLEHRSSVIGIVVDSVTEVLRLPDRIIEQPSMFVTGLDAAYISGIAKFPDRLITVLDVEKIFVASETVEK